jgi:hypothetical protein
MAANYCQCIVPVFVCYDEPILQLYVGRIAYGAMVQFDIRTCEETPVALRHLAGITDYFHTVNKNITISW